MHACVGCMLERGMRATFIGYSSPYPTPVSVTSAHQSVRGIERNHPSGSPEPGSAKAVAGSPGSTEKRPDEKTMVQIAITMNRATSSWSESTKAPPAVE